MRAVPLFAGWLIAATVGAAAAQPAPTAPQPDPEPAQPEPAQPEPAQPEPAQPEPAPPEPAQPEPAPPQPPSASEVRDDPAWRLYDEAFGALLRGQHRRAAELAAKLRREHAGHPAALLVATSPLALARTGERRRQAIREEPTSAAASELALFQTLHGLAVGIEICVVFSCQDEGVGIALSLAGAVGGAVASLKGVAPLTSGQRALLNGGTAWGAFNALMAIIAIDPATEERVALGMLLGQSAGLATGALLFDRRPTAGQVALASSGGQWGAVLMALMYKAASPDPPSGQIALGMLVAADAGLGMGAYLATVRPDITRAQTLVIDAGGIFGVVAGGGIGVLISGSIDDRATSAVAGLGVAAGLGAAAYLTRNWNGADDDRGAGVHAMAMPPERGRGGLFGLAGAW